MFYVCICRERFLPGTSTVRETISKKMESGVGVDPVSGGRGSWTVRTEDSIILHGVVCVCVGWAETTASRPNLVSSVIIS